MKYTVDNAKPEDAEAILEHTKITGSETDFLPFGEEGYPITIQQEEEFIQNLGNNGVFLMVKNENQDIVASASSMRMDNMRRSHVFDFGIAIEKAYWGQGIAKTLIDRIIEDVSKIGCEKIMLYVDVSNEKAIKLYQDKGFEIEGTLKRNTKIRGEFIDNYVMGKIL